jgi:hypothetical protein
VTRLAIGRALAPGLLVLAAATLLGLSSGCGSSSPAGSGGGHDSGAADGAVAEVAPDVASDVASDVAADVASDTKPSGDAAEAGGDASDAPASVDAPAGDAASGGDAAGDAHDGASDSGVAEDAPASGSPLRALSLATGVVHACVLLDNHRVKCWGMSNMGNLGLGDDRSRMAAADLGDALPFVDLGTGRTAKAISAGRYPTCAILDDGSVKCWGWKSMIGLGTSIPGSGLGDQPGEMGDALPTVDLGAGRTATQIVSTFGETCAVLDDNSVRCWGGIAGATPQTMVFARPNATAKIRQLTPVHDHVAVVFDNGSISEVFPTSDDTDWRALPGGQKVIGAAGTNTEACVILEGGGVRCTRTLPWPAPTGLTVVGLGAADSFTCGLLSGGAVRCWGTVDCRDYPPGSKYWCPEAQLPDHSFVVALGQPAVALGSGGYGYNCALLADGGVKCWLDVDMCTNSAGGGEACAVPTSTEDIRGGTVEIKGTGSARKFGAWHELNFGTHR